VWLALAAVLAVLWRRPGLFALVIAADLFADVAALALKVAIGRDRPPVRYAHPKALVTVPKDGSFPSGHAATSFACATILALALPRRWAPWLFLLAAAIGFSRIYVGVHYALDVIGGAALGILVATALRRLAADRRLSMPGRRAG
jgi:undecaprenyl-diphosphatase